MKVCSVTGLETSVNNFYKNQNHVKAVDNLRRTTNAPKIVKGGVSKSKGQQAAEAKRQQLSRLKKSGKVADAAKIFRSLV